MKNTILFFIFFFPVVVWGQGNGHIEKKGSLGVHMGTDIGGAIPFPFKNIPEKINAYPQITLALGGRFAYTVSDKWGGGMEVTYKTVKTNSDARLTNQKFQDENAISFFTGTAESHLSFTMVEIPIYVKYNFRNKRDRILAGPYFSSMIKTKFVNKPRKGFNGPRENTVETIISDDPKSPNYMSDMDFTDSMDSWDIGIMGGYERRITNQVDLGLRVSWGFKDIFKRNNKYFDYSMRHIRGSLVISYKLIDFKTPKLL